MKTPQKDDSQYLPLYTYLKKGESYSLNLVNWGKEQSETLNRHHHIELVFVEKGTLGCFIDSGFFTAVAGDIVIINPLQTHRLARLNQDTTPTVWVLNFDENLLVMDGLVIGERSFDDLVKDPQIAGLFRLIIQEKKQGLPWSNVCIQNLIRLIVLHLLRDHASETPQEHKVSPLLQAVITHIHENFSKTLTLESIGDKVGVSRWYLSKFFKNETGMSIVDYINQYRCSHALGLLLKSDYPIAKIAEMCGFSTLEYFSRVYSKQYGHPPSRERELKGKGDTSAGLFATALAAKKKKQ